MDWYESPKWKREIRERLADTRRRNKTKRIIKDRVMAYKRLKLLENSDYDRQKFSRLQGRFS